MCGNCCSIENNSQIYVSKIESKQEFISPQSKGEVEDLMR